MIYINGFLFSWFNKKIIAKNNKINKNFLILCCFVCDAIICYFQCLYLAISMTQQNLTHISFCKPHLVRTKWFLAACQYYHRIIKKFLDILNVFFLGLRSFKMIQVKLHGGKTLWLIFQNYKLDPNQFYGISFII